MTNQFTRQHLLSLGVGTLLGAAGVWCIQFTPPHGPSPQSIPSPVIGGRTASVTAAGSATKKSLPSGGLISDAVGVELPAANSSAFAALMRSVFDDPSSDRRLGRLRILLENAEPDHFAALIPLIRENDLRGTGSADEWNVIWKSWGQKDGESAMKFLRTQDWTAWDPEAPGGGQYQAMSGWAAANPDAARNFLENASDKKYDAAGLRHAMMKGWAIKDPVGAADWLLAKGGGNSNEFQLAMDALCRSGGQEAVDGWFASKQSETGLDPESIKQLALAVNHIKSRFEPEKAARWVEQNS